MSLKIGDTAPLFELYNTKKELVELAKLRGRKVVLLFFPAAFTSTCTRELCSVRDDKTRYNDLNAEVFGISTDAVYSLIRYKEEQNLNFELLSDFNKEVSAMYDSLYELFNFGMRGVSKRSAFVIDENGIIRYAEVVQTAGEIPDFNKIKEAISLQFS